MVCHHFLFCIHFLKSYGYEIHYMGCNENMQDRQNNTTKPHRTVIHLWVWMLAVFGLSRGEAGWNQSRAVIGLILLKEPGHHVAGVPVTPETNWIFRNVLILLACMPGNEGMICCVCWCRTGQDENGVKWLLVSPQSKQRANCGLKAAVRFTAPCHHHTNMLLCRNVQISYSRILILLALWMTRVWANQVLNNVNLAAEMEWIEVQILYKKKHQKIKILYN